MANSQVTPAHIVPEWYFLPFYAILRAIDFNILFIDSKLGGVIFFAGSIADPVLRAVAGYVQGALGHVPADVQVVLLAVRHQLRRAGLSGLGTGDAKVHRHRVSDFAKICTAYYFIYFLVILPLLGRFETPRPLPPSISEAVLKTRRPRRRTRTELRGPRPAMIKIKSILGALAMTVLMAVAPAPADAAQEHSTPEIEQAAVDLRRHLRHLRQEPAAARLPGVPRSLRQLPRRAPAGLPQPVGTGWSGVLRGSGQGARCRVRDRRRRRPKAARARALPPTAGRRPSPSDADARDANGRRRCRRTSR